MARLIPCLSPALGVALLLHLSACVPRAPKTEDALLHYLWAQFDGSPQTLTDAASTWIQLSDADLLVGNKSGAISHLQPSEIAGLPLPRQVDLGKSRGFYYMGSNGCSVAQMEGIFSAANQPMLFPDTYDAFARTYTADLNGYLQGAHDRIGWQSDISTDTVGARYELVLQTELRSVQAPSGQRFLVARTFQPKPATFQTPGDNAVEQDFHMDVYVPRADGRLLHLYVMWGQMHLAFITSDSDLVIDVILKNLAGWDDIASRLCQQGYATPTPTTSSHSTTSATSTTSPPPPAP